MSTETLTKDSSNEPLSLEIKILCNNQDNQDNQDGEILRRLDVNSMQSDCTEENLSLRFFNRLKTIERQCKDENEKMREYYSCCFDDLYKKNENQDQIDLIHQFNNDSQVDKSESDYFDMLKKSITVTKMKHELLAYELQCYKPRPNICPDIIKNTPDEIKKILDHFNPLIQYYLEDKEWLINYDQTLNFAIPDKKVVISNTISNANADNSELITHLNHVKQYIKNRYMNVNNPSSITSLKYSIIEDSKYDMTWILWNMSVL